MHSDPEWSSRDHEGGTPQLLINTRTPFLKLTRLLDEALRQTVFDAGDLGAVSLDELRAQLRHQEPHGEPLANCVVPKVPEHELADLAECLRPLLKEHIDASSDRVGNGLASVIGGVVDPTMADLARVLVRASVALGVNRTAQLFTGWIERNALEYRTCALLSGVTVEQPLEVDDGIVIRRLPPDGRPLPDTHMALFGYQDFLGGVVLSVDCEFVPIFYPPSGDSTLTSRKGHVWAHGTIPHLSLDTLCEALSLACNDCVRYSYYWDDFGDLAEFSGTARFRMSCRTGPRRVIPSTTLLQKHLEQARSIHTLRHRNGKDTRRFLDTAIGRWMKSKDSESDILDQFIDLRIALEALYLKGAANNAEMRFRLATYGAWHLGVDASERHSHHDILRRAYDLASRVVHAGEITAAAENRTLLSAAQDICRKGILKRIKEAKEPSWNELILGTREDQDT